MHLVSHYEIQTIITPSNHSRPRGARNHNCYCPTNEIWNIFQWTSL